MNGWGDDIIIQYVLPRIIIVTLVFMSDMILKGYLVQLFLAGSMSQ